MARKLRGDPSIIQKYDASCFDTRRRKGKRAKTASNKRDRQFLKHDLDTRSLDNALH